MYKTFTIKTDPINPTLPSIEVCINGNVYKIKREEEIYACETKAEMNELKKKGLPVVPMAVFEALKNNGSI